MLKRLFVLLFLAAAILSVSSRAHAATGTDTARSSATAGMGQIHRHGIDALTVVKTKFYSDATYTVQVGYRYFDQCNGESYMEGTQTDYFIRTTSRCACALC